MSGAPLQVNRVYSARAVIGHGKWFVAALFCVLKHLDKMSKSREENHEEVFAAQAVCSAVTGQAE